MTFKKSCVEEEDIPTILERWLKCLEQKQLNFEHAEKEGGHMFSATLCIMGESIFVRLIRNGQKEILLESDCLAHGCHRYNLKEKKMKEKAGLLYDNLFLRWKGIIPG